MPARTSMPFSDALPKLLQERSMSLRELGRRLGVDPTYLSRIKRGKKGVPADLPERVAAALELPNDYFPESRERIILEAIRGDPRLRELVYDTISTQSPAETRS
jgi:transcriptional regulator with XRE-family HTH domain